MKNNIKRVWLNNITATTRYGITTYTGPAISINNKKLLSIYNSIVPPVFQTNILYIISYNGGDKATILYEESDGAFFMWTSKYNGNVFFAVKSILEELK